MSRTTLAVLSALALLLGACGGGDTDESTASEGAGGTSGGVTLTAADLAFDPTTIDATVGEETTINLTNEDDVEHNITVEDLDVDADVEASESTTVTFTASEAGEFEFFCKYHPDQMRGTINAN